MSSVPSNIQNEAGGLRGGSPPTGEGGLSNGSYRAFVKGPGPIEPFSTGPYIWPRPANKNKEVSVDGNAATETQTLK